MKNNGQSTIFFDKTNSSVIALIQNGKYRLIHN